MGYLSYRSSFKLTYRQDTKTGLDGFADSDWGNNVSRRSTTGLVARYNKSIVIWRSKLQKTFNLTFNMIQDNISFNSGSRILCFFRDGDRNYSPSHFIAQYGLPTGR